MSDTGKKFGEAFRSLGGDFAAGFKKGKEEAEKACKVTAVLGKTSGSFLKSWWEEAVNKVKEASCE